MASLITDEILKMQSEIFESPCNYGNIDEFMLDHGGAWCEQHCGKVSDMDCWRKYFELKKAEE